MKKNSYLSSTWCFLKSVVLQISTDGREIVRLRTPVVLSSFWKGVYSVDTDFFLSIISCTISLDLSVYFLIPNPPNLHPSPVPTLLLVFSGFLSCIMSTFPQMPSLLSPSLSLHVIIFLFYFF